MISAPRVKISAIGPLPVNAQTEQGGLESSLTRSPPGPEGLGIHQRVG